MTCSVVAYSIMQCGSMQCHTVSCSAVAYSVMQCHSVVGVVRCSGMQCSGAAACSVPCTAAVLLLRIEFVWQPTIHLRGQQVTRANGLGWRRVWVLRLAVFCSRITVHCAAARHWRCLLSPAACTVAECIDGRLQEAFSSMYNLTRACTYQIKALSAVGGNLSRSTTSAYRLVLNDVSRLHLPSDDEAKRMQKRDARTQGKKAPVEQNPDKADTLAGREIMWRRWVRAIETRDGANNIYK